MKKILSYFRREVVLTVALLAAVLSFLLAAPGMHVIEGIDATTLLMLFSLMTIVAGFRGLGAFDKLAAQVTLRLHTLRTLSMALTASCFLLAMVATNDVALITLVPFTLLLMGSASPKALTLTVVLETIAANLGSMVTPIGNPQNLYLYASGKLTAADFPVMTWPYALISFLLLMALCGLVPATSITTAGSAAGKLPRRGLLLYTSLTVLALFCLAKLIPAWALAALVLAGALLLDRPTLRQVDYTLLATFVCFFVFVANVKACAPISAWLEGQMARSPLLVSALVSQVISNVPACLLLSPFTGDVPALMLGVNLGGLGTLVASLASLISFRLYGGAPGAKKGLFMVIFTVLNVLFLAVMLGMAWLLGAV